MTGLILAAKEKVLELLVERHSTEKNEMLRKKYSAVRENILMLDPTDSNAPTRQLTMLQLIDELENGNE